jgi:chromosome partitioning protein
VLALASSKGGVGRTTLAAALAVRAVERGRRVALIDRDPQESLAAWADRGGRRSNPHLIDIDSTAEAIGLPLAQGSQAYDYAIIDTPRWQMDLIEEVIAQASFVLIPCRASALDLTALDPVAEMCQGHKKPFAFVLNAVHPERKILKSAPGVLRKRGPLCETMIVDRAAYVSAMTVGKGPTEVEQDMQAATELDALWTELEVLMRMRVRR